MVWREKRLSKSFVFVLGYPMGQAVLAALKFLFGSVCLLVSKNISDVTCEGNRQDAYTFEEVLCKHPCGDL